MIPDQPITLTEPGAYFAFWSTVIACWALCQLVQIGLLAIIAWKVSH